MPLPGEHRANANQNCRREDSLIPKNIEINIPLNMIVPSTGVSGFGENPPCLHDVVYKALPQLRSSKPTVMATGRLPMASVSTAKITLTTSFW